jgi:hypothetical protein
MGLILHREFDLRRLAVFQTGRPAEKLDGAVISAQFVTNSRASHLANPPRRAFD